MIKVVRRSRQPIKLIRQASGGIKLVKSSQPPIRLVRQVGVVINTGAPEVLPALPLTVVANGQTVWDLGLSEPRRILWVGGLRYFEGQDYTIDLPLLTWHGHFAIKLYHQVLLTN